MLWPLPLEQVRDSGPSFGGLRQWLQQWRPSPDPGSSLQGARNTAFPGSSRGPAVLPLQWAPAPWGSLDGLSPPTVRNISNCSNREPDSEWPRHIGFPTPRPGLTSTHPLGLSRVLPGPFQQAQKGERNRRPSRRCPGLHGTQLCACQNPKTHSSSREPGLLDSTGNLACWALAA